MHFSIGRITGALYQGPGHPKPVKYAAIDFSTSGNKTLVAAVSGKKLRLISAHFIVAGAQTWKWTSGLGGTGLSGTETFAANGGIVLPKNEDGHLETVVGEALCCTAGASVVTGGALSYVEVDA